MSNRWPQQSGHLGSGQTFGRRQGALQPFGASGGQRLGLAQLQQQQQLSSGALAQTLGGSQPVEDDSNSLFQSQQPLAGNSLSLADQLAATFGLDPSNFGAPTSLLHQANTGYSLVGQQPGSSSLSSGSSNNNNNNNMGDQQQQQQFVGALSPTSNFGGLPHDFQRPDAQCVAADGRHGTCYQAGECIRRGGTPMGRCGPQAAAVFASSSSASSLANQPLGGDQLTGSSHVCCLFDVTCGQFAAERFVYFRNPGYPQTFDHGRMCRAKIGKLDKGVCQLRLDLLRFDIGKPTNGNCSQDMFVVSGQNENNVIPKICGLNDGQHYYVGVDESGVITLHMMMMGLAYRRSFEILITQIPCRSDFAAPAHCLQYFMGTHGTIKSFNYDEEGPESLAGSGPNYGLESAEQNLVGAQQQFSQFQSQQQAPYGIHFNVAPANQLQARQQPHGGAGHPFGLASNNNNNNNNPLAQRFASSDFSLGPIQFGGYPNDLDYSICIRKESGFCSISYALARNEQTGQPAPFQVGATSAGQAQWPGAANDSVPLSTGAWHQGPVSTECRDDYLLVGGVRLCSGPSERVGANGALYEQFALNSANFSAASNLQAGQQQMLQLQQQHSLLMQQLTRLQQQQQQAGIGNSSSSQLGGGGSGANLEQQQAALLQQLMLAQQQMSVLASANNNGQLHGRQQFAFETNFNQPQSQLQGQLGADPSGSPTALITDTTSGPFMLRFVSNMARNARGFHIDFRQNPCK